MALLLGHVADILDHDSPACLKVNLSTTERDLTKESKEVVEQLMLLLFGTSTLLLFFLF